MSAPTGIRSGVGFRNLRAFALGATGLPDASSTTAYEGVLASGSKVFTINDPEPRKINFPGDDTLITIDVLPPLEGVSGEIQMGKMDDILDAILTGQKIFTLGEATMFGIGTNKRGYENQVGLLAYRQAQDTDPNSATFGLRCWESRLLPKAVLFPRETGLNEQPENHIYTVTPMKVGAHLWGTAFTEAVEGFVQTQMLRICSWGKPKLVAFKGDGVTKVFTFPTDAQAKSTATITVWDNGVVQTSGITKATTGITFTTEPTSGHIIVVFYEV